MKFQWKYKYFRSRMFWALQACTTTCIRFLIEIQYVLQRILDRKSKFTENAYTFAKKCERRIELSSQRLWRRQRSQPALDAATRVARAVQEDDGGPHRCGGGDVGSHH